MRKMFDNTKLVYTLDAEVYTADTTGTDAVDTQGYNDAMVIVLSGDVTYTTAAGEGYTVKIYESDDDDTYTDSGIAVTANVSNTASQARITDLNVTRKRYLKAVLDVSATTTSWEGAVAILLGEPVSGPVNSD